MKSKTVFILFSMILIAYAGASTAAEMPPFKKADRILILAAHPDDETIGAAGVIQKALKAGAKVKVALYTNGDNNEPAFSVYEKRLTFRKGEFIHMGEVRRLETVSAMNYLGLNRKDLIFLGYPDFGTMAIFTRYWGGVKPFKSFFTRVSKVPYPECLSPGAPYAGESILKDLKKAVLDFKPTKIFISHPADKNGDHRSLYLFLRVALWDLEGKIAQPELYPFVIHIQGWPKPRGYHPEFALDPPQQFTGIPWLNLSLTQEEIARKRTAISRYKSQVEYDPPYLFTFARRNELFGDYPAIILKKGPKGGDTKWSGSDLPGGISYAYEDSEFHIKFDLKGQLEKDIGILIFLFGYNKNREFSEMPKIRISIGAFGISFKDKFKRITIKDTQMMYEGHEVIIKMPLEALGDPDHILASVQASGLSLDQTAWRIIELSSKQQIASKR